MDLFNVLTLCCGLAFFLFGMQTMSHNLERLAGGKLEGTLKKMTASPIVSCALGAIITIAMQSSSACTVMLVGLVNSGIMHFAQTLNVIFGANIGTTLTAWILSLSGIESDAFFLQMLKPVNFSPILAVIGVFMTMLAKKERNKSLGNILVGFAVLMYGMSFMSDAVSPLADMPEFGALMVKFNNPAIGVIVGALFTALIQSSAASVGILQALAMTGSVTYGMAIPIIMGQNIGTCITAVISCIGANAGAKRVAVIHTLINILGTIIILPVYLILNAIFHFPITDSPIDAMGIALCHTLFNIIATALLMPNGKLIIRLTEWLTREKGTATEKDQICILDERLLRSPSIAVRECAEYTKEMCVITRQTLQKAIALFDDYSEEAAQEIVDLENTIDLYEDRLGTFLVKLSAQALSQTAADEVSVMLHTIGDFERMSDHAVTMKEVAEELREKNLTFSDEARHELNTVAAAIEEILALTEKSFLENDGQLATKVEPLEQVVDQLITKVKANHIARLQRGECSIVLGFILSDLLHSFSRISDHCSNVAVTVIEVEHNSFDTHQYLNAVKYGDDDFAEEFNRFAEKYPL
ncbi:MAG: Na/Pi cotransporter family protein [Oscillospiraceae bacterium]|nr:Na/Pi cotransporter family protein [Oscillospiraceae bacterium]